MQTDDDAAEIQCGFYRSTTNKIISNTYTNFNINFTKSFKDVPVVIATLTFSYTPYKEVTGPNIITINTTYFTCRVYSVYPTDLDTIIGWIGIRKVNL